MNINDFVGKLPKGWATANLQDLIGRDGVLVDGDWIETKDQDPQGNVRLIQLTDIGDGFFRNRSQRFLTSETAQRLKCTFLKSGDVLVARMPEPLGRACIFPGDAKHAVTAVDICIIRTGSPGVKHSWLVGMVNSPQMREKFERLQKGTTRKRISRKNLISISFPVPTYREQERIAVKVEELLSGVEKAKGHIEQLVQIVENFRKAVLDAACSGQLTEDWRETHPDIESASKLLARAIERRIKEYEIVCANAKAKKMRKPQKPTNLEHIEVENSMLQTIPDLWTWVYLPELGELNRGRSRHRPRDAEHLYAGPYPFIQTGDIAQSGGRITHHKQTYSEAGLAQSRLWAAGTVCITIAANIANSAILTYPACFPDSVVGLIVEPELCDNRYIEFFIRTARKGLSRFAPATAQKNINIGILSNVAVPLPPYKEQVAIADRVDRLLSLADTTIRRLGIAEEKTVRLTQSILSKAFIGELVPTEAELARKEGRDYETAKQLLTRIKAEREKRPKLRRKITRRTMKEKPSEKETPLLKSEDNRLLEVLLKAKEKKLTPDQLFKKAGFDEGSIDDFYEVLRAAVQAGQIKESRPKKTEIYLEAVKT